MTGITPLHDPDAIKALITALYACDDIGARNWAAKLENSTICHLSVPQLRIAYEYVPHMVPKPTPGGTVPLPAAHPAIICLKACGDPCGKSLPHSRFSKRNASVDGLQATCRDCSSAYSKAYAAGARAAASVTAVEPGPYEAGAPYNTPVILGPEHGIAVTTPVETQGYAASPMTIAEYQASAVELHPAIRVTFGVAAAVVAAAVGALGAIIHFYP